MPEGGNQVFIDGGARWVDFTDMYMLHSWNPGGRLCNFYQDSNDFDLRLKRGLSRLAAQY